MTYAAHYPPHTSETAGRNARPIRLGDKVTARGNRWSVHSITFYDDGSTAVELDSTGPIHQRMLTDVPALTYDPDPLAILLDVDHAEQILAWVTVHVVDPERDGYCEVWQALDEAERAAMRHLADAITTAAEAAGT